MTADRTANAKIIGQLEGHLAELEASQRRKESGRAANLLLFVAGAGLILLVIVLLSLGAANLICFGVMVLVGLVLALMGGAGFWDAMRSTPRIQADIVSVRSRLAELRALMMG